jgi:hypothetical protein
MPLYNRREHLLKLMLKGADIGSEGAQSALNQKNTLEQLLKGDELKAAGLQRDIEATKGLQRQFPGVAVKAGGASIGAPERMGRAGIAQQRLEASGLNRVYTDQTKPVKEKLQTMQDIAPLLEDPTNIDDQQLRRTMAMAVNKGALSDTDVEDSLPGDIEQTFKKAYNWAQPAISKVIPSAKKMPIYSEETVQNIRKLVDGKMAPLQSQLEEAGNQVRELAPAFAPTLSEDPELLEQTLSGITGAREAQQKRIQQHMQQSAAKKRLMELRQKKAGKR